MATVSIVYNENHHAYFVRVNGEFIVSADTQREADIKRALLEERIAKAAWGWRDLEACVGLEPTDVDERQVSFVPCDHCAPSYEITRDVVGGASPVRRGDLCSGCRKNQEAIRTLLVAATLAVQDVALEQLPPRRLPNGWMIEQISRRTRDHGLESMSFTCVRQVGRTR